VAFARMELRFLGACNFTLVSHILYELEEWRNPYHIACEELRG
jgi:hypothetical protein